MKKVWFLLCSGLMIITMSFGEIEMGININYSQIHESLVRESYGPSWIYTPTLEVRLIKGFHIGVSYDSDYKQSADIGLFNEQSHLTIRGGNLFLTYQFGNRAFAPYLKAGIGRSTYEQEIDSDVFSQRTVSQSKTVMAVGGGIKYYIGKFFFLNAEIRYSPFNVEGAGNKTLNIGGIKAGGGLGIRF